MPGIDAFQLVNLGYDLDELFNTKLYGFNWEKADEALENFILTYKKQLLSTIKMVDNDVNLV
jgi:hypothetical protein